MTFEYEYTWDDYRAAAAVAAIARVAPRAQSRSKARAGVILILLISLVSLLGAISIGQSRHHPVERLIYSLAASMFPMGLIFLTIYFILRKRRLERERPHEHYIERGSAAPTVIGAVCLLIGALAIVSADPQANPRGLLSFWEAHQIGIIGVGAAGIVMTLLFVAGRHALNKRLRAAVEAQGHFRVDAGVEEITFDRGSAMSRFKWVSMARFTESADVFLLYPSAISFQIVPKRAMTPVQIEEFRQLLLEKIQPATHAFPVSVKKIQRL